MAITFNERQDLLFDSQLSGDKVIYRLETTQNVPLAPGISSHTTYTFAHGLPSAPLCIGSYSTDDFVTSFDFGIGPYEYLPTYTNYGYSMLAHCWSDATNVYIRAISHNTARTIKFRVIGLLNGIESDTPIEIDIPPIQDKFLFSSDFNYLKQYTWMNVPMTADGTGSYVTQGFSTEVDTPLTLMCFMVEDGKYSYMNTMNTITVSGVTLGILTKPNYVSVNVADTITKDVNVLLKTYLDA